MQPQYTTPRPVRHGVGEETLRNIHALRRQATSPFTVADAAAILSLDPGRTRQLLAYLAKRGWLARVRRGLYANVPIDADDARTWQEDPWAIAARAFAPCYIGGWSACEHWGLTDQIFREIVVVSGRQIRQRHQDIQGIGYRVKVRPIEKWSDPAFADSREMVALNWPRFDGRLTIRVGGIHFGNRSEDVSAGVQGQPGRDGAGWTVGRVAGTELRANCAYHPKLDPAG